MFAPSSDTSRSKVTQTLFQGRRSVAPAQVCCTSYTYFAHLLADKRSGERSHDVSLPQLAFRDHPAWVTASSARRSSSSFWAGPPTQTIAPRRDVTKVAGSSLTRKRPTRTCALS